MSSQGVHSAKSKRGAKGFLNIVYHISQYNSHSHDQRQRALDPNGRHVQQNLSELSCNSGHLIEVYGMNNFNPNCKRLLPVPWDQRPLLGKAANFVDQ